MAKVVVLLSIGQNPVSGRSRMARAETRAIEMALAEFDSEVVIGLHAASARSPILREYLGLGMSSILHVETRPDEDPFPALIESLRQIAPDIVLCGQAAETGRSSGMMAYACGDALRSRVIANVFAFRREANELLVVQDMGRGRHRQLQGPCPVVLAIDAPQGSAGRVPAMANMRAGRIEIVRAALSAETSVLPAFSLQPARVRPKKSLSSGNPTTRAGGVEHLDPDRAAERILDYLRINQIIQ